jgi:hypothetical protein
MISPAMDTFIPYVSDPKRLINLTYLRLKWKINIILRIKFHVQIEEENITGGHGRHTPYGQIPSPLAKFLEENDIVTQYSLPYEPQQNDVAERRNHTLMDMVRNMLSNSTLPLRL